VAGREFSSDLDGNSAAVKPQAVFHGKICELDGVR
jgi:hypothetical protein